MVIGRTNSVVAYRRSLLIHSAQGRSHGQFKGQSIILLYTCGPFDYAILVVTDDPGPRG